MTKWYLLILASFVLLCCKHSSENVVEDNAAPNHIKYAKGFTITEQQGTKIISIKNPWPGANETFNYALTRESGVIPEGKFDAVVKTPITKIVVTSTTHIPSLEMLGMENRLVGFPNLEYISSKKTRNLIDRGSIIELGKNEDLNTEVLIDLSPDLVVTFAVKGNNSTVSAIKNTGIPVMYNGDWTETHPLGKAEWIKFFGVLFDKEKEADSIFSEIEKSYKLAKAIAAKAKSKPTVLSGAMYKDIWYMPQGESWAATFIMDAQGDYLWSSSPGTGSISLNLESVIEKGKNADFWVGPGQFASYQQMREAHSVYEQFEAFKNKNVFTFTKGKGTTGGVLYYELAPNRPDLVLKDMIKILHPTLLPNHELFFFSPLDP